MLAKLKTLNDLLELVKFDDLDLSQPSLVRVAVDSKTAEQMLALNKNNRLVRRRAVEYLQAQIVLGEWRDDHPQPVVFSSDGILIDGQHRIYAIAESNVTEHDALVVRVETGASYDVREYMDTGVPRTLDDRVYVVDDLQANKLAAQLCNFSFALNQKTKRPTPEQFRDFFNSHQEAILAVAAIHKREIGVGKIQVTLAAMEFHEISPVHAKEFYRNLFMSDGEIQQARMLRDFLIRAAASGLASDGTKNYRTTIYAKSVYCMKKYLAGENVKKVMSSQW